MAGATTSTLDPIIKPEVRQEISDAVFRNSDFLPLFRQEGPFGGGTYDLKVIVAANSSAQVFNEDGVVPDAGYQQSVTAAAPWKHFRVFTRLTGHAKRELNATWDSNSWPGAYGGMNIEEMKAQEDLVDLVNTTFLGTSASGVQGIIDDSTAFYDLSRSSYTALKSYEKAGSAAMSLALLDRLVFETYNAPFGGKIELILMPPAQARKYTNLVEGKLNIPSAADVSGGGVNSLPPYAGAAVLAIRDLTATVVLGLSNMSSGWFYAIHEAAPGGIDVLPYGVQSDAKVTQYVTSGALICPFPNRQGKLTTMGTT